MRTSLSSSRNNDRIAAHRISGGNNNNNGVSGGNTAAMNLWQTFSEMQSSIEDCHKECNSLQYKIETIRDQHKALEVTRRNGHVMAQDAIL